MLEWGDRHKERSKSVWVGMSSIGWGLDRKTQQGKGVEGDGVQF